MNSIVLSNHIYKVSHKKIIHLFSKKLHLNLNKIALIIIKIIKTFNKMIQF